VTVAASVEASLRLLWIALGLFAGTIVAIVAIVVALSLLG
jgi:hypothetical protein